MKKVSFMTILMTVLVTSTAWGQLQSSPSARLKEDLRSGRIDTKEATLKEIVAIYGEPDTIDTEKKKLIYNYGDLAVEFSPINELYNWNYFNTGLYHRDETPLTLRADLESLRTLKEVTFEEVLESYGDPSQIDERQNDTLVHYGDFKLYFKKEYRITGWTGSTTTTQRYQGVLQSSK